MEIDRAECISSIRDRLHRTALWRESMRQRFPTDPRNLAAIDLLNQIASQVLSDADWHRLEPHFALTSAAWQHAVSEASRVVGFKTHSPELGSFVRNVVGLLECTQ